MEIKILQKEEKVLRDIAKTVPIEEIKTPKITQILKEMKTALDSQEDGVAIAAPQIGYSLRIFLVSRKVEEILDEAKQENKDGQEKLPKKKSKDMVFINPIIKKLSKKKMIMEEGCLSVRYLYGQVERSKQATVVAYDENGQKFERGGTGLMAQIFQHEIEHLDGILFIDKASNVEDIPPESPKRNDRKSKNK